MHEFCTTAVTDFLQTAPQILEDYEPNFYFQLGDAPATGACEAWRPED